MHLKRNKVDKKWPIPRKGTKYVVSPKGNFEIGIPLLIVLRDMLKLGKNRKEVKKILNQGFIEVNNRVRKDEKFPVLMFDLISVDKEKTYRLIVKNKKFALNEEKSNEKISKVLGKTILKNNKTQINLFGGLNYITDKKIRVGDSVVIDFAKNEISKVIPLEKGKEIIVIRGKHICETGKIKETEEQIAEVILEEKQIEISLEDLMAI